VAASDDSRALGWGFVRRQVAEALNTPPRDTACMRRCELNIVVGAVAGSQFKMACFTRSVVWRFWTAVLLLSDVLLHLARAVRLEEHSNYQACVASPATCVRLCVFLPLP